MKEHRIRWGKFNEVNFLTVTQICFEKYPTGDISQGENLKPFFLVGRRAP